MNSPFGITEVAKRLDSVLAGRDSRRVAEELKERVGYETSYEKVRRARKGLGNTIAHDLIAAVALAYDADASWILTGVGTQAGGTAGRAETPETSVPAGSVPPGFRDLFFQMERVLAEANTPALEKAYLLDTVVGGMRIAGLIEEGAIAKARIQSLDGERGLAKQRQDVIDRAEESARSKVRPQPFSPAALAATGRSLEDIRDMLLLAGIPDEEVVRMIRVVRDIRDSRGSAG